MFSTSPQAGSRRIPAFDEEGILRQLDVGERKRGYGYYGLEHRPGGPSAADQQPKGSGNEHHDEHQHEDAHEHNGRPPVQRRGSMQAALAGPACR